MLPLSWWQSLQLAAAKLTTCHNAKMIHCFDEFSSTTSLPKHTTMIICRCCRLPAAVCCLLLLPPSASCLLPVALFCWFCLSTDFLSNYLYLFAIVRLHTFPQLFAESACVAMCGASSCGCCCSCNRCSCCCCCCTCCLLCLLLRAIIQVLLATYLCCCLGKSYALLLLQDSEREREREIS